MLPKKMAKRLARSRHKPQVRADYDRAVDGVDREGTAPRVPAVKSVRVYGGGAFWHSGRQVR